MNPVTVGSVAGRTIDLRLEHAGLARGRGGRRRWLVREVDLAPRAGELLALVGPNGAGKSTLLRLLAGLWAPTEGRVLLDGLDLRQVPRREAARRVTYVPQHSAPAFDFTVRELVAMGGFPTTPRFALGGGAGEDRWVAECLERADVLHLAARGVTRLSGGELQRVMIARGLATRADVVLLDEPTANLDLVHQFEVLELARELAGDGRGVVLAIHDLNAALRWADRVAVIDRGRLLASGTPHAVLEPDLLARVFGVEARRLEGRPGEVQYRFELRAEEMPRSVEAPGDAIE